MRSRDFLDHLVTRAVVKRAYVELRERAPYLGCLTFYTVTEGGAAQIEWVHPTGSKLDDIDVVLALDEVYITIPLVSKPGRHLAHRHARTACLCARYGPLSPCHSRRLV